MAFRREPIAAGSLVGGAAQQRSQMPKTAFIGSLLTIDLRKSAPEPIHRQLTDQMRAAILTGRLPPGSKLPSTRVFATELRVGRNTVLQVFETLTGEGLLSGRVGSGTFVTATTELVFPPDAAPLEGAANPFRTLSHRGRGILASAAAGFSESPTAFMPDVPDLREFPIKAWMRLLNETSGRLTGKILVDTPNAGYEPLRHAIASHLNAARGMRCDAQQVIVTTGSQQSLDLVCRMLLDTGDPVWFEDPGYIGSRAILKANGASLHPVRVDSDGMCVEDAVERCPTPRLIITSPSRHYPLGATLSLGRRQALLKIARENGTWLLEDDYDNEFRYEGNALPAIAGLDRNERTFHVGTFSKVLLPSLRLGYIVVPHDFAAAFAEARAVLDRHTSLIEQMVLAEFMTRGLFISHVRRMRTLYRDRQAQFIEGLDDLLGSQVLTATATGMHVVIRLADNSDDVRLVRMAAEQGVVVRPLSPYYHSDQTRKPGLLLGFAAYNKIEIQRGLGRLGTIRTEIVGQLGTGPGD